MKNIIFTILAISMLATTAFAALKVNDAAPTFSQRSIEGKDFNLNDVVGAKSREKARGVILSFFASWCVPCRHELPLFNALTDEFNAKGIKVVLVNEEENTETVKALVKDLKINKPIVLSDRSGKIGDSYQLRFLPTTFFIGADGNIKDVVFGEMKDADDLKARVEKLLK